MRKRRILIVDDEEYILSLLKRRLEHEGYEVLTAMDGTEGLKKAKETKPDLILLDIMLPKIEGFTICRILKYDAKYRQIPIIMITALSQDKYENLGLETGADAYFTKPFDMPRLLSKIRQLIDDEIPGAAFIERRTSEVSDEPAQDGQHESIRSDPERLEKKTSFI